jgi:alpha-glucosidase
MPDGALAFRGADGMTCVVNTGTDPVSMPAGDVLISSAPLADGALLPADAAAWVR